MIFTSATHAQMDDFDSPVFVPIIMIIESLKPGPRMASRSTVHVDEMDHPPSYDDLFPERNHQSGISNLELMEAEESDL